MPSPYRERRSDRRPLELAIDVDRPPPPGGSMMGVVIIAACLAFAIYTKLAVIPVVLVGLGGGSTLWWLAGRVQRRALLLAKGTLSLRVRRGGIARRVASIATGNGVFVSVEPTGLTINGIQRMEMRIVGARGAISLRVMGAEVGERVAMRIRELCSRGEVALLDDDAPLRGGVREKPSGPRVDLEWGPENWQGGSSTRWVGPVVITVAVLFSITRLPVPLAALVAALGLAAMFLFVRLGRPARTRITVGRDGYRLQTWGDGNTITEGPELLRARVERSNLLRATPADAVSDPYAVVLSTGGEYLATVGHDLSRPELLWVAEKINEATDPPANETSR